MLLIQFVLGTIIGSFLFASYSRLTTGGHLLHPARSECDGCATPLAWFDLIPVVSYLLLSGRCRYCHQKIPAATLCCELFFGSLLLTAQPTLLSLLYLTVGSLLFFMADYDFKRFMFPASYGYCLMFFAVTVYTLFHPHHLTTIFLMLVWLSLQVITIRLTWIGSGDLEVLLCLLIILGLMPFIWLILLSSGLALIISLISQERRLPFVPFIAVSYLIILFFI